MQGESAEILQFKRPPDVVDTPGEQKGAISLDFILGFVSGQNPDGQIQVITTSLDQLLSNCILSGNKQVLTNYECLHFGSKTHLCLWTHLEKGTWPL